MNKLNCIIVDDNSDAIQLLEDYIKDIPKLNLVKSFTKPIEALQFIENNSLELVLLDIEMPQLSGLDFIETVLNKKINNTPKFILISSYSEYALRSYDYKVEDYIMKPVSFKRLSIAIDRLSPHILTEITSNTDFFFLEVENVQTRFNMDDIVFLESSGNYLSIFKKKDRIVIHKTISSMETILDMSKFIRIHKSFIVSLSSIMSVKASNILINYEQANKLLPIGITYKDSVIKRLNIKY
jgi:two-component system, LytTR family, response regulator